MTISLENKHTLQIDDFKFRCCIGRKGLTFKKKEGDKKTPKGIYKLGNLYFRKDRVIKPETKLKCVEIRKNMNWCDDVNYPGSYNKLIRKSIKARHEKLFRRDHKYDLLLPIGYNLHKPVVNLGSCIFLHLTKNYKPTAGCIAVNKKDFLIILKLINKKTKIKIS